MYLIPHDAEKEALGTVPLFLTKLGGVMHTIADGWRLQVWTRLRTSENLFQLNYQLAGSAGSV